MSPAAARRQTCISPLLDGAPMPDRPPSPLRRTLRRIAITVAGTLVVAAGVAMVVLPGPGLVTIALGLSILGREHEWAAALERRARARLATAVRRTRRRDTVVAIPARTATDDRLDRAA
jgi:uncharacterized protein (TIGR02611 family)